MNSVEYPYWSDRIEEISGIIYQVASQIRSATKKLSNKDMLEKDYRVLAVNIYKTLDHWTGKTYVGMPKDKAIQKAFQAFFIQLYEYKNVETADRRI